MSEYYKSTPFAWLRMIGFMIAVGLGISLISCTDDGEEPYIDPDSRPCCRCIGDDCPDGGEDAGPDAGVDE